MDPSVLQKPQWAIQPLYMRIRSWARPCSVVRKSVLILLGHRKTPYTQAAMKLAFTLAASAFLATVPITASPVIPNTFTKTAIIKKDTAIVSPATVSNIIHPTITTLGLQPETWEPADETDSDVDEEDESDESDEADYSASDYEDYVTTEDVSDDDVSDDDASSHNRRSPQSHTAGWWNHHPPASSPSRRTKAARAEDYGYTCANTKAKMVCKNNNGVIECDCLQPMEPAIPDEKVEGGYRCKSGITNVPVRCYSGSVQSASKKCWCYPPAEKAIKKNTTKRDVTSESDSQATKAHNIISAIVDRRSGIHMGGPGYHCENKEAKMECPVARICGCVVTDKDGKRRLEGWPVKDDEKRKRRDLASGSVEPESGFEAKSKRDLLQFDVSVMLPGDVVKALTPKKRDLQVKREVEEEHFLEASMLKAGRDANGQDHELFARKNMGYGTRLVKCKERGDVAGFCLISGYCYCLQCRDFPDHCAFMQRKGVGDSKERKRDLALTDSLDGVNPPLEARTFASETNTNPGQIPKYTMKITSQVIKDNKPISFTCGSANGGFCFEGGCYCVQCAIGLNDCRFKKVGSHSNGGGGGSHNLQDRDLDELLTIDEGGGMDYEERSFGNEKLPDDDEVSVEEKRGGSGLHRTSPFGRPVTVGRRSAMPDNQAILDKRNKGFDCTNALGAFCFTDDECFCLRCNKFPNGGCRFEARKFFRNTKIKRDSDDGVTASSEREDIKSEVVDVVPPPTMTTLPTTPSSVLSNTSVPLATATAATFTSSPDNVANRNGHNPEFNIFARGKRAYGHKPDSAIKETSKAVEPPGANDTEHEGGVDKLKARDQASGAGSACTLEGAWNCIDGKTYQQCAAGVWTPVMPLAAGTTCAVGSSTSPLNITATAVGKKMRRLTNSNTIAPPRDDVSRVVAVPTEGKVGRSLEQERQEGQDEGTHRVAIPGAWGG
ncbi:hypothetical protein QBC45DRAFT_378414 [Copromyces sp. CBS 386.78]|nr:hypothetical protein QBC45DRAFT_378414 [Copromyces sp. CBS 386.78]